ncbi:hypothetical protein [Piscinibacter gummiphilus]|uniref:hypothetical protein n=1 Tax=Piscinibacter gummiphilus TaxID=946333 RepID=UPI0012F4826A|nr:hypothetical protein [Piscinibacter gummiphilus]
MPTTKRDRHCTLVQIECAEVAGWLQEAQQALAKDRAASGARQRKKALSFLS